MEILLSLQRIQNPLLANHYFVSRSLGLSKTSVLQVIIGLYTRIVMVTSEINLIESLHKLVIFNKLSMLAQQDKLLPSKTLLKNQTVPLESHIILLVTRNHCHRVKLSIFLRNHNKHYRVQKALTDNLKKKLKES